MTKTIYLIEKAWTDSMENDWSAAFGYDPFGYVESEEEAKAIVKEGGFMPATGWPISKRHDENKYPVYRYKAVVPFAERANVPKED